MAFLARDLQQSFADVFDVCIAEQEACYSINRLGALAIHGHRFRLLQRVYIYIYILIYIATCCFVFLEGIMAAVMVLTLLCESHMNINILNIYSAHMLVVLQLCCVYLCDVQMH